MGNQWGSKLRLSIFGESYGMGCGIVIDGLPPGIEIDMAAMTAALARRAPGGVLVSARRERDIPHLISGCFEGKSNGAPLTIVFHNEDVESNDYQFGCLRPGHGDYPAYVKYHGYNDYRGGGHLGGRLTAPLVAAGSIAASWLEQRDIHIGCHFVELGGLHDEPWPADDISADELRRLKGERLPLREKTLLTVAERLLDVAAKTHDSLGAVVEAAAINLPVGLGEPFFDSAESIISSLLFAIPGIKGVEFGSGFGFASLNGSAAADEFYRREDGGVGIRDNHNGGILGGLTSGAPLIVRAVFKPTSTLSGVTPLYNIGSGQQLEPTGGDRHDPCIAVRGLVAVEAVLALALMEMLLCSND
ncbi:MAG: chorismate synthase [Bacillota bacterium]|nr:chorismate synthase [Bacillota bacterium]